MQKFFFICTMILCLPLVAAAQEYPKAEVFGGYSYFRGDLDANFHGWNASVAGNLNKSFGVVGDFSGHYIDNFNLHLFQVGPKFTYRESERVHPYFQALFGGARLSSSGFSDTAFALTVGGGVDVKVHKNVAIRVIDAGYVLLRNEGQSAHNGRISAGLVFRFGGD
ncbi:MAG: porin family protein [Blastocatellia bacterium]|nr:porin family protein [Blastocatellia bacterium]